jgi:hypothetical protein
MLHNKIFNMLGNTKINILSFFCIFIIMGRLVVMAGSHSRDITIKRQQYTKFKLALKLTLCACKHLTLRRRGNINHI